MILFIVLWLLWVLLNGKLTLEIALFGVGFSAVLTLFSYKFLGYGSGKKHHSLKWYGLLFRYFGTVLVEIVKANIAVLKISMARHMNFEPQLVYFTPDIKTDASRVLLANSITITPGTITVLEENGHYCVHALDKSLAEGIDNSVFVRLLQKMEEA